MKRISIPLAMAGALVGLALVIIFKPDPQEVRTGSSAVSAKLTELQPRRSAGEVMVSFQASGSALERLKISAEFRGFASDDFEEALELSGYRDEKWGINQATSCLLVAWAEKDARAAVEWAWAHLKGSGRWEEAFNEVVRTWVENDPIAVIEFFKESQKTSDDLTLEEATESEAIVLDQNASDILRQAFFANDSSIALLAIQEGVGLPRSFSPRGLDFGDLLNTVEEVEEAVKKWKDVEGADQVKFSLANRLMALTWESLDTVNEVEAAMKKWKDVGGADQVEASLANRLLELAPAQPGKGSESRPGFQGLELPSASNRGPVLQRLDRQRLAWSGARVDFKRTVAEAQSLEGGEREAVFLAMYDSWHLAHPGEEPDLTLLPEDARKLWQDLDGLGPVDDSFSSSQWSSEDFQKVR